LSQQNKAKYSSKQRPLSWQWSPFKSDTLRKKRRFLFSYCELSIYM